MVLGQVIAGKSFPLHQFDQGEAAFIERVERPAVAVQVVENPEFKQSNHLLQAGSAHRRLCCTKVGINGLWRARCEQFN